MTTTVERKVAPSQGTRKRAKARRAHSNPYPRWFLLPGALVYVPLFLIPTLASFFFSLTRWNLTEFTFIGLDNFVTFFSEPTILLALSNTFVFAVVTSVLKVVLGLLVAVFLTSKLRGSAFYRSVVFFPVIVSVVGVGFTFSALMRPDGVINSALALIGIDGPNWLADPNIALISVALVETWKGIGFSAVIFMAAIASIPGEVVEAARVDGASGVGTFRHITLPLVQPATVTVTLLSVISGLRSFEMVWAMTQGGPGGRSDVIASVIYKQYGAGFYGLATAGNVILFLLVAAIAIPMSAFLTRREGQS